MPPVHGVREAMVGPFVAPALGAIMRLAFALLLFLWTSNNTWVMHQHSKLCCLLPVYCSWHICSDVTGQCVEQVCTEKLR